MKPGKNYLAEKSLIILIYDIISLFSIRILMDILVIYKVVLYLCMFYNYKYFICIVPNET